MGNDIINRIIYKPGKIMGEVMLFTLLLRNPQISTSVCPDPAKLG